MNLTEEITKTIYDHWQTTGQSPETLRITKELWDQLKQEAEDHKMLVDSSEENSGLFFNGLSVSLIDSNTFLRYALQ